MPVRCGTLIGHFLVGFMALVGALVGAMAGQIADPRLRLPQTIHVHAYPLPHCIPKYPGGISLRFAMIHDVIHERYARHGRAYYAERNRRVRRALDEERAQSRRGAPAARVFSLDDDLGAGLEFLGDHAAAVHVLRDKLRRQEALGQSGRALYTTYANLGTFLIHGNAQAAIAGDPEARARLREGLRFIRQAIKVNPRAHFGREVWQAVSVEFLLAAIDDPQVLLRYDLIGDRLDFARDPSRERCLMKPEMWGDQVREATADLENPRGVPERVAGELRVSMTRVGAQEGWNEWVESSQREPVPFDEPCLGIIGMWRLGGGANPHFALALGEIMMLVGQRYLAWSAYERAVRMASRFWPDRAIQRQFVDHCRRRQAVIEDQLPADERADLQDRFELELDHGLAYQAAYQDYEAEHIREGGSLDDPHFYDRFEARWGPIASPVGEADQFLATPDDQKGSVLPLVVVDSGLFALGTAGLLSLLGVIRRRWSGGPWIVPG